MSAWSDPDGKDLIARVSGYESTGYIIYRRVGAGWVQVYTHDAGGVLTGNGAEAGSCADNGTAQHIRYTIKRALTLVCLHPFHPGARRLMAAIRKLDPLRQLQPIIQKDPKKESSRRQ